VENYAGDIADERRDIDGYRNDPVPHEENTMPHATQQQYPANAPSRTGNPSGGGRSNNTPKG